MAVIEEGAEAINLVNCFSFTVNYYLVLHLILR